MLEDKTLQKILRKVSNDTKIPLEVTTSAYRSFWGFIKTTIEALPIKEVETEEEFNNLRTSFNIPSIGKLYSSWDRICRMRTRYQYAQKIIEKKKNEKNSTED